VISLLLADGVLLVSLVVSLGTYVNVSKREHSYFNVLTPSFIISVPAYYLLPWGYFHAFGNENSVYAYTYVYTTLAVENVAFAYMYTRSTRLLIRLPFGYSYHNFDFVAFGFIGLAFLMYVPILLQFPEYLLDPRQIYVHTRTGFGVNYFISSRLAYLAVILIQFSGQSRRVKGLLILIGAVILALHGSKGQVLSLVLLVVLFHVYVRKRTLDFLASLFACLGLSLLLFLLFAATMALGDSPAEMEELLTPSAVFAWAYANTINFQLHDFAGTQDLGTRAHCRLGKC